MFHNERMAHTCTNTRIIICDCGYGWPSQKRPKLERQRSVAKQLVNYLLESHCSRHSRHVVLQNDGNHNDCTDNDCTDNDCTDNESTLIRDLENLTMYDNVNVRQHVSISVIVIGTEEDLIPLYERIKKLLLSLRRLFKSHNDSVDDSNTLLCCQQRQCFEVDDACREVKLCETGECVLRFDSSNGDDLLASVQNFRDANNDTDDANDADDVDIKVKDKVIYLSPDSPHLLDCKLPPPKIVVIGMLVDRSVALFRSSKRAELLEIESACLPLKECMSIFKISDDNDNDDGIISVRNDEPLNIDTVLMLMYYWYNSSCYRYIVHDNGTSNNEQTSSIENTNKAAFVSSTAKAMLTHQDRHPNRTLHKR